MIALFSKQAVLLRRGNAGQATVLLLTAAAAILSVAFASVYVSHLGAEKVAAANAVDAVALSAATWEARGLNMIAALNDGILQCLRVIRWTCIVWAALAVTACFGVGIPAFVAYSRRAIKIIRSYWKCARQLAEWSEKVKEATPYLVLAETVSLSKKLSVVGTLLPLDPRGAHDRENTLELHVAKGPPIHLVDALGPIIEVPGKIGKSRWSKKITRRIIGVVDAAIRAIIGAGGEPIRMLVPESDFAKRQKIRFAGFRSSSPLPIADPAWSAAKRFYSECWAEPHGGGAASMTWRSRLTGKPEGK